MPDQDRNEALERFLDRLEASALEFESGFIEGPEAELGALNAPLTPQNAFENPLERGLANLAISAADEIERLPKALETFGRLSAGLPAYAYGKYLHAVFPDQAPLDVELSLSALATRGSPTVFADTPAAREAGFVGQQATFLGSEILE